MDLYKIIIYPGSFNPITNAHLQLAKRAVETINAQELIFLPTGENWMKEGYIEGIYRYRMIASLLDELNKDKCSNDCRYSLNDFEIQNKDVYTKKSLSEIEKQYSYLSIQKEIYVLMGDDNLKDLSHWKEAKTLISNYHFLIMPRKYSHQRIEDIIKKDKLLNAQKKNFIILEDISDIKNISSTRVRNLIKENNTHEVLKYINKDTYQFIQKYDLYNINNKEKGEYIWN